ncbi:MAG: OmpA family protein [Buchnera aphidicola (Chaetogeoica yunlongensis)]
MKSNIIFKIIMLTLPITTAFSCSLPNDKIVKDSKISSNVETTPPTTTEKSSSTTPKHSVSVSFSEKNTDEQLTPFKQENLIYFSFNDYNINSKFSQNLNDLAKFLCDHPSQKILIEGHTDNRGTINYNLHLGEKRANSVKLYLKSKGVSDEQISTVSYGPNKPFEAGDKESTYAKNRRSVIVYR